MDVKLKVIVHEAEEGGYWAEVPALPGCFTQGETKAELRRNIQEAVDLYLETRASQHRTRNNAKATSKTPATSKPAPRKAASTRKP